jgi:hypothetical protein
MQTEIHVLSLIGFCKQGLVQNYISKHAILK